MRFQLLICGLIVASSAIGQEDIFSKSIANPPIPTEWKKAEYQVAKADSPPKIDGKLDDPCWKTALHGSGFYRFRSNDPVKEQTELWICSDRTRLYVAFHCIDSHPELVHAHETQREGNFDNDDMVGIAIDSQGTRRNVSEFDVNALGTQRTQLEGGTAENIAWAGDWRAAAQKVADGYTVEISIPFALLRHARGAKNFPLVVIRQIPRETNAEIWPYIPVSAGDNPLNYLNDFICEEPLFRSPKPLYLPYVLGTTGEKTAFRAGMDIKYPISPSITGLATIFPDFATVEQAVQDLSFSYTEKFLPDHRPYFAEGNSFFQDPYLFYSQRISQVDGGLKIVGKQGRTTVGMLGTTAAGLDGQSSFATLMSQDFGLYSQIGGAVLANNQIGMPANRVAQISGKYGWKKGDRETDLYANTTGSWLADGPSDNNAYIQLSTNAGRNKPGANISYGETGKDFTNQLGLVPETDIQGYTASVYQQSAFDKGKVERQYLQLNADSFRHKTGGFFHDSVSGSTSISFRNGWYGELDADAGNREEFHDNTVTTSVGWNQKTLFQRGSSGLSLGHRQNMPYSFFYANQGFLLSKRLTVQASFNQFKLGDESDTQTVLSTTYRLNREETFGGRLIQHGSDLNLYLSYGKRTQGGTDVFFLIGNPNSANTRGIFTVKFVRPF